MQNEEKALELFPKYVCVSKNIMKSLTQFGSYFKLRNWGFISFHFIFFL